jgi:hypothetical protein
MVRMLRYGPIRQVLDVMVFVRKGSAHGGNMGIRPAFFNARSTSNKNGSRSETFLNASPKEVEPVSPKHARMRLPLDKMAKCDVG